jgi:peptidoglycan biosynthesis protein MviN/MurJ (putative lipid II flippase)
VKHIIHTLLMVWVVRDQTGGLKGYGISRTILKSILAALVTGAAAYAVATIVMSQLAVGGFMERLLIVFAGAAAGVLAYTLMVFMLNIREAKRLPKLISNRS